jgi:hypothetical protein
MTLDSNEPVSLHGHREMPLRDAVGRVLKLQTATNFESDETSRRLATLWR